MYKSLILFLFSSVTYAGQVTDVIHIDPPTQYEDNTILDQSLIQSYQLYYAIDTAVTGSETPIVVMPGMNYNFSEEMSPRSTPYVVNFAATVTLKNGKISALSNILTKNYQVDSTANPKPPMLSSDVNFTATCVGGCTVTIIP